MIEDSKTFERKRLVLISANDELKLSTLVSSSWLEELDKTFNVNLIINEVKKSDNRLKQLRLRIFEIGASEGINPLILRALFFLETFRLPKELFSFRHRVRRQVFGPLTIESFRGLASNIKRLFTLNAVTAMIAWCAAKCEFSYEVMRQVIISKMRRSEELFSLLKQISPDVVICLVSGFEQTLLEIEELKKSLNFRSVVLINNWDNLSSKAIPPKSIDCLLLWNEQQREFARIHGFPSKKVKVVGSPKIDRYRNVDLDSSVESQKSILYVGQQNSLINERKDIESLTNILAEYEIRTPLFYRPHPNRKDLTDMRLQIEWGRSDSNNRGVGFHPLRPCLDLANPVQFNKYLLVVGPPTTMILEALGNGCPAVLLLSHDDMSRTSSKMAWKHMAHLRDLEKLKGKGFWTIDNVQEIRPILKNLEMLTKPDLQGTLENLFPYFSSSFDFRIKEAIIPLLER